MKELPNADIRKALRVADIRQYEMWGALGLKQATFYRRLQAELPAEEKARWLSLIKDLSDAQDLASTA